MNNPEEALTENVNRNLAHLEQSMDATKEERKELREDVQFKTTVGVFVSLLFFSAVSPLLFSKRAKDVVGFASDADQILCGWLLLTFIVLGYLTYRGFSPDAQVTRWLRHFVVYPVWLLGPKKAAAFFGILTLVLVWLALLPLLV